MRARTAALFSGCVKYKEPVVPDTLEHDVGDLLRGHPLIHHGPEATGPLLFLGRSWAVRSRS